MTSKYEIETTAKYLMKLSYNIEGVVEVQDVIGALFGQTEGLMNDLELRELQKNGRIGRIKVENNTENGKSFGIITIPSSLSRNETILLAAALESVDRVGPCIAEIKLIEIKDVRHAKMDKIKERALELMKKWKENAPESGALTDELAKEIEPRVIKWNDIEVGPLAIEEEEVILVEGRADIINLFRIGVLNTIAVNGVKIPQTIRDLSKTKKMGAFLDGDRGGDMILSELLQTTNILWVARAPKGKEVENLERDELKIALDNKIPVEIAKKQLEEEIAARAAQFAEYNKEPNKRKVIEEDFEEIVDLPKYNNFEETSDEDFEDTRPQGKQSSYQNDVDNISQKNGYNRRKQNYKNQNEMNQNQNPRKQSTLKYSKRQIDSERNASQRAYQYNKESKPYEPREKRSSQSEFEGKTNDFNRKKKSFSSERAVPKVSQKILDYIKEIKASNEGYLLDDQENIHLKVPNTEVFNVVDEKCKTIILDGVIAQRLVDRAAEKKVQRIFAVNIKPTIKIPEDAQLELYKFEDFVE